MSAVIIVTGTDPALPGLVELARPTGLDVTAVVVGTSADGEAAGASGVSRVVLVTVPDGAPAEAASATVAGLVADLAPRLVLGPTGPAERVLLGAAAAGLDAPVLTAVTAIEDTGGALQATRSVNTGVAEQVERTTGPLVVCTDPIGQTPAPGGSAPVEEHAAGDTAMTVTGTTAPAVQAVDLGAAQRVVTIGRGLKDAGDLHLVEDLAAAMGAEVACTRPLAEGLDWLPVDRYIGVSGHYIAPSVYVGIGISGQLQHMVGVRRSDVVVAVNTDKDAPIFAECDYGIVGDLYQVVPALTQALKG